MTIPNRSRDFHPADRIARLDLMADLRRLRLSLGMSLRDVAVEIGALSNSAIQKSERGTNWRIVTPQRLARVYRRQLVVDICGIEIPDDDDPLADMYARMRPAAATKQDELARAVLVNNLVRIRRSYGWSQRDMAAGLGVAENAVWEFEQCAPGVMSAPVQRYARVLDGWLRFRLEPVAAAAELVEVA